MASQRGLSDHCQFWPIMAIICSSVKVVELRIARLRQQLRVRLFGQTYL